MGGDGWIRPFFGALGTVDTEFPRGLPDVQWIFEAAPWTTAILGFPVVFAPALVVAGARGGRETLVLLLRLLRRPAALLIAFALLFAFQALPIGRLLYVLLGPTVFGPDPGPVAWTIVSGVATGISLGLLVYAVALLARALVAVPLGDPPGFREPRGAGAGPEG